MCSCICGLTLDSLALCDPAAAINPNGQVPAIDDDGTVIYESHTIMRYITHKYKMDDHWYPADPVTRARIDQVSTQRKQQAAALSRARMEASTAEACHCVLRRECCASASCPHFLPPAFLSLRSF